MKTLLATTIVLLSTAAWAQQPLPPPPPPEPVPGEPPPVLVVEPVPEPVVIVETAAPDHPSIGIGLKAGVLLPQVATELGAAPVGVLELSFAFPVAERRVGLYLEAGYSQPKVERENVTDPRVTGGMYNGTQTQRELTVGGGLVARLLPPKSVWNGYALLGARGYFLETITVGDAGSNEFGENREKSSKFGGYFAAGGERRAGPGVVLLEVGFGTSDLDHLITGDVSTGAIAIQLGYRFLF
jgi:hypothetical protein